MLLEGPEHNQTKMAASSREEATAMSDLSMQLLLVDPKKHDPHVIKDLYDVLLRIKSEGRRPVENDGFTHCRLCIQSSRKEISDLRFRVKLFWTGNDVKKEIFRLYEIPANYQVLIVNNRVISDHENLENCHFQEENQIVFIVLTKKRIQYKNSGIRLLDFLPEKRSVDVTVEEDNDQLLMTSQPPNEPLRQHPLPMTSQSGNGSQHLRHNCTVMTSQSPDDESSSAPRPMTSQSIDDEDLFPQENGLEHAEGTEFGEERMKNEPESGYFSRLSLDEAASSPPATKISSPKRGGRSKKKKKKK